MEKQKWINKHAMEDWELENTQRANQIINEHWNEQDKNWEKEYAKEILNGKQHL